MDTTGTHRSNYSACFAIACAHPRKEQIGSRYSLEPSKISTTSQQVVAQDTDVLEMVLNLQTIAP